MILINNVNTSTFFLILFVKIETSKGPFKYYVIKEVGGWGCQMMIFDDKVGGWGWLNDDVSKKYTLSVSKLT